MNSDKVDVRFTTAYDVSNVNHVIGVIGSCNYLGRWDPKHALLLERRRTRGYYSSAVKLPLSRYFEWKLIVIDRISREVQRWEECCNRWNWVDRGPLEIIVAWNTKEMIRCSSCRCLVGNCSCTTIYTKLSPPENLVDVTFKVNYSTHDISETITLIGSSEFLGDWCPTFSRQFSGNHNPVLTIQLPMNTCFEWKLAILNKRHRHVIQWEERENHKLKVQTCPLEVGVTWNRPAEVGHKCYWMDSCWVVSLCPCENRHCSYTQMYTGDEVKIGWEAMNKRLTERRPKSVIAHTDQHNLLRDKHVHFSDDPVSEVFEANGNSITSAENIDGFLDLCMGIDGLGLDEIAYDCFASTNNVHHIQKDSKTALRNGISSTPKDSHHDNRNKCNAQSQEKFHQQTHIGEGAFSNQSDKGINSGNFSKPDCFERNSAIITQGMLQSEKQTSDKNSSVHAHLHPIKHTDDADYDDKGDAMSVSRKIKPSDRYNSPAGNLRLIHQANNSGFSSTQMPKQYNLANANDLSALDKTRSSKQRINGIFSLLAKLELNEHANNSQFSPREKLDSNEQVNKGDLSPVSSFHLNTQDKNDHWTQSDKQQPNTQSNNIDLSQVEKSLLNKPTNDIALSPLEKLLPISLSTNPALSSLEMSHKPNNDNALSPLEKAQPNQPVNYNAFSLSDDTQPKEQSTEPALSPLEMSQANILTKDNSLLPLVNSEPNENSTYGNFSDQQESQPNNRTNDNALYPLVKSESNEESTNSNLSSLEVSQSHKLKHNGNLSPVGKSQSNSPTDGNVLSPFEVSQPINQTNDYALSSLNESQSNKLANDRVLPQSNKSQYNKQTNDNALSQLVKSKPHELGPCGDVSQPVISRPSELANDGYFAPQENLKPNRPADNNGLQASEIQLLHPENIASLTLKPDTHVKSVHSPMQIETNLANHLSTCSDYADISLHADQERQINNSSLSQSKNTQHASITNNGGGELLLQQTLYSEKHHHTRSCSDKSSQQAGKSATAINLATPKATAKEIPSTTAQLSETFRSRKPCDNSKLPSTETIISQKITSNDNVTTQRMLIIEHLQSLEPPVQHLTQTEKVSPENHSTGGCSSPENHSTGGCSSPENHSTGGCSSLENHSTGGCSSLENHSTGGCSSTQRSLQVQLHQKHINKDLALLQQIQVKKQAEGTNMNTEEKQIINDLLTHPEIILGLAIAMTSHLPLPEKTKKEELVESGDLSRSQNIPASISQTQEKIPAKLPCKTQRKQMVNSSGSPLEEKKSFKKLVRSDNLAVPENLPANDHCSSGGSLPAKETTEKVGENGDSELLLPKEQAGVKAIRRPLYGQVADQPDSRYPSRSLVTLSSVVAMVVIGSCILDRYFC